MPKRKREILTKLSNQEKRLNSHIYDNQTEESNDEETLKIVKLDKQAPIKKMNGQYQRQLPRPINSNINECTWCFASLSKLTDFKKIQHIDNCKYKLIQNCLICSRNLANLNEYNRKTHIEFCRIRNEKKKLANKKTNEKNQTGLDKNSKQTKIEEKNVKKNETAKIMRPPILTRSLSKNKDDLPPSSAELPPSEIIDSDNDELLSMNSSHSFMNPLIGSISVDDFINECLVSEANFLNENEIDTNYSVTSNKCRGYKPNIKFQSDGLYSNFPFQALDSDRENLKFVFENGVFHNLNCAKNDYQLKKDSKNNVNRLCSDLSYHRHLQNILKRSQILNNFSQIPHTYLTYNQLKIEIKYYRETLRKIKLDNLNFRRTIESLKAREENYKKFLNLLGQNEYENLSQLVTVCINQKKGINGIIEKLLDTQEGVYHPRDSLQFENISCKICNRKVCLSKMRDHVTNHLKKKDVKEDCNRCGFCGDTNSNCSIDIKKTSNNSIWPISNCNYFKNFNLKLLNKSIRPKIKSNIPIECELCKKIIWSLNKRAHILAFHKDSHQIDEISSEIEEIEKNATNKFNNQNTTKNVDLVSCKICNNLYILAKMRDHVATHIVSNELEESSNRCGFCGLNDGCNINIVITSGNGKNTKYGPSSNCKYFRKFNLKSSTKPTKSSPSTNRPIECHICKQVFWSYNMRSHFKQMHPNEESPELLTDIERELVLRT